MQLIAHRKNTIAELQATPASYGVEIDLRSWGTRLILQHEPFRNGTDFADWLRYYCHKTLILNIKEEGIEYRVKEMLQRFQIEDYFFLDLSFPALVKMMKAGEKRVAVRFSEYEALQTALGMAGKVQWVWVDCFSRMPLQKQTYRLLAPHFKLCLVSPELLGRDAAEIKDYKRMLAPFRLDAVCTKRPDLWQAPS